MNGVKRILKFSRAGLKSLELSTMNVLGTKSPGDVQPASAKSSSHYCQCGRLRRCKEMVSKLCDWSFITPPDLEAAKAQVLDIKIEPKRTDETSLRYSAICTLEG